MIDYPKRETYRLKLVYNKGYVVLEYKQASAQETLDYANDRRMIHQEKDIARKKKMTDQFNEQRAKRVYDHIIYVQKPRRRRTEDKVKKTIAKVRYLREEDILKTLHKTSKSVFENIIVPKQKGETPSIFDNSMDCLIDKTLIPIDEIYNRLTLEQIIFILDKARYDVNENFKEWKSANSSVRAKQWLSEKQKTALQIIQEQEEMDKRAKENMKQ